MKKTASQPSTNKFDFGGDAKIAITSGLNLDLMVNPDFSQVEVDRQVLNLERFEVFFPERRQFFLENSDLFGGFGDATVNPFFSRKNYFRVTPEIESIFLPFLREEFFAKLLF